MPRPQVPAGYSPPFATVSDNDHTAWILIAACLGIVYSVFFGGFRTFVRYTSGSGFGLDDAMLAVSTILGVVQSSVILGACSDGLGKSIRQIPPDIQDKIQQMYFGSNLLFITALGLSKISVVLFLQRLTPGTRQRRTCYAVMGFIAVWTVASLLALALQCNLPRPWLLVGLKCPAELLRWQIICTFGIGFGVAVVCMAVQLVWSLQTSLLKKSTVVAAFAFRLVMIIPIGFRLATFDTAGLATNPTLLEDRFIIWTQVERHYSLISATILCLRPVIVNFVTHYGALGPAESSRVYASGRGSCPMLKGAYEMSNLKSMPKTNDGSDAETAQFERAVRGEGGAYSYGITPHEVQGRGNNASIRGGVNLETNSLESNDSKKMIIKKNVSWKVEHERM